MKQLCKDYLFGDLKGPNHNCGKTLESDAVLDDAGQRTHRQLLGILLWLDFLDIQDAVCQLSIHVGTATTRDESNVKLRLKYRVGNSVCNKVVGCTLNVLGIPRTPQGYVLLMTDAD